MFQGDADPHRQDKLGQESGPHECQPLDLLTFIPPPVAETRIYKAQPKGVQTTVKTTWADRMTTTVEYPANYDGKDYPVEGSRDVDAVVLSRMDDFTSAATLKHAGKEIGTARRVVSPDGKTMTISYKGINTRGDKVDNIAVYDRQ